MSREIIVDNVKCGGIVKQVRLQLNCTQEELGKKIGVDQPTMCRLSRCFRRSPTWRDSA